MRKKLLMSVLAMTALNAPLTAFAEKYYGKGYTIVDHAVADSNDINFTVYRKIKSSTIHEAIESLLEGSGWRLANIGAAEPEINRLYQQPLPDRKRKIGPMAFDEALIWLIGDAWVLVTDPVNKLISFELSDSYQCFPSSKAICRVGGQ